MSRWFSHRNVFLECTIAILTSGALYSSSLRAEDPHFPGNVPVDHHERREAVLSLKGEILNLIYSLKLLDKSSLEVRVGQNDFKLSGVQGPRLLSTLEAILKRISALSSEEQLSVANFIGWLKSGVTSSGLTFSGEREVIAEKVRDMLAALSVSDKSDAREIVDLLRLLPPSPEAENHRNDQWPVHLADSQFIAFEDEAHIPSENQGVTPLLSAMQLRLRDYLDSVASKSYEQYLQQLKQLGDSNDTSGVAKVTGETEQFRRKMQEHLSELEKQIDGQASIYSAGQLKLSHHIEERNEISSKLENNIRGNSNLLQNGSQTVTNIDGKIKAHLSPLLSGMNRANEIVQDRLQHKAFEKGGMTAVEEKMIREKTELRRERDERVLKENSEYQEAQTKFTEWKNGEEKRLRNLVADIREAEKDVTRAKGVVEEEQGLAAEAGNSIERYQPTYSGIRQTYETAYKKWFPSKKAYDDYQDKKKAHEIALKKFLEYYKWYDTFRKFHWSRARRAKDPVYYGEGGGYFRETKALVFTTVKTVIVLRYSEQSYVYTLTDEEVSKYRAVYQWSKEEFALEEYLKKNKEPAKPGPAPDDSRYKEAQAHLDKLNEAKRRKDQDLQQARSRLTTFETEAAELREDHEAEKQRYAGALEDATTELASVKLKTDTNIENADVEFEQGQSLLETNSKNLIQEDAKRSSALIAELRGIDSDLRKGYGESYEDIFAIFSKWLNSELSTVEAIDKIKELGAGNSGNSTIALIYLMTSRDLVTGTQYDLTRQIQKAKARLLELDEIIEILSNSQAASHARLTALKNDLETKRVSLAKELDRKMELAAEGVETAAKSDAQSLATLHQLRLGLAEREVLIAGNALLGNDNQELLEQQEGGIKEAEQLVEELVMKRVLSKETADAVLPGREVIASILKQKAQPRILQNWDVIGSPRENPVKDQRELTKEQKADVISAWHEKIDENDLLSHCKDGLGTCYPKLGRQQIENAIERLFSDTTQEKTQIDRVNYDDGTFSHRVVIAGNEYDLLENGALSEVDSGLFDFEFVHPEFERLNTLLRVRHEKNFGRLPEFQKDQIILGLSLIQQGDSLSDPADRETLLSLATDVSRIAIGFTPAGDAIDLYEGIWGRSLGGETLTAGERSFAMLGVLIGNRTFWSNTLGPLLDRIKLLSQKIRRPFQDRQARAAFDKAREQMQNFELSARRYGLKDPGPLASHYSKETAQLAKYKDMIEDEFRVFNNVEPGPLSNIPTSRRHVGPVAPVNSLAATFRGGSYFEVKLKKDLIVYRVYNGDEAKVASRFWTLEKPTSRLQATLDYALDPEWNNASFCVPMKISTGTKIYVGAAEKIKLRGLKGVGEATGELYGGGTQIVILEPEKGILLRDGIFELPN